MTDFGNYQTYQKLSLENRLQQTVHQKTFQVVT